MLHHKHNHVSSFSRRTLRGDFISLLPKRGLNHVSENILSYLDAESLCAAELVCAEWYEVISQGMLWKKLIERHVRMDLLWRRIMERRGLNKYLFKPSPDEPSLDHMFYRRLYPEIIQDIRSVEINWQCIEGHIPKRIHCQSSDNWTGVRCLQYDEHKIVSGSSDSTIKIWDRNTLECIQVLTGHNDSVQCLQFDDRVIISGSWDSTVRVWDVKTGELINTLIHRNAVFHLRFKNGMLVTYPVGGSIVVWNMVSPSEITIQREVGNRGNLWAVDFDGKYIVAASFETTINVWNTSTGELVRTLEGHKGVLCLQYRDRLVVSGGNDGTIKLWDIESGACLRTLGGHNSFVNSITFDNKRIVSSAFNDEIKVWDLAAALDASASDGTLCLGTSVSHFVYTLQIDDFQIVACSGGDSILIWDFLNGAPPETPAMNM